MFAPRASDAYVARTLDLVHDYDKRQQVLFNLYLNGPYLCQHYLPEELVQLNDDMLAQHSPLEEKKKLVQKQFDAYHNLLQKDFLEEDDSVNVLLCGKCGKGGINFNTKQVSAADEGSTTFCACPHCGLRWRMS